METLVEIARWLGVGLLAYFIGAIPTAYLFARFALGSDIRGIGDNNSGAANVYREIGPKAGLACGAIDIVKGGVAVLLARLIAHDAGIERLAGICALAAHIWPVFLRFRGGRGAAVAVGVMITMLPLITLPLGALSLVALYHTRKSMVPLAMFLAGVPLLSWVTVFTVGSNVALAGYALAVPVMAGLSHLYATMLLPRFQQKAAEAGAQ